MKLSPKELREALPNPVEIIKELDKYIIDQTEAKKMLAVMLLNRALYQLSNLNIIDLKSKLSKSNVLLVGPTGTGKTALIKALSEVAGIPITIYDVSGVTASGYIGCKVENVLSQHIKIYKEYIAANRLDVLDRVPYQQFKNAEDLQKDLIENGIIYLDEIDKLRMYNNLGSDIGGEMVQNELLKFFEEAEVDLDANRRTSSLMAGSSNPQFLNTKNMFFICGGAFSGIEDIIERRLNKASGMGFNASLRVDQEKTHLISSVTTEDLIEYGFKPEFLGRLPLRAGLNPLSQETLIRIISEPKDSVFQQYKDMFEVFGIDLILSHEGAKEIANVASDLKIGARALKNIFSNILTEELVHVFEAVSPSLVITKELVLKRSLGQRG